jgi:neuralized-like protein 4
MLNVLHAGPALLKAGDVALGGKVLGVRPGHIRRPPFERTNAYTGEKELFDKDQIFTSPSIVYCSLPQYASPFTTTAEVDPKEKATEVRVQVAFQVRLRPGSYGIGQETVGAKGQIDPRISNAELEYYTRENVGCCIHGLLVKVHGVTNELPLAVRKQREAAAAEKNSVTQSTGAV